MRKKDMWIYIAIIAVAILAFSSCSRQKEYTRIDSGCTGTSDTVHVEDVSTGTVIWFNAQKGFGFIIPDDGGDDLFVHHSEIKTNDASLNEGQKVEFEIGQGKKGPSAIAIFEIGQGKKGPRAINVVPVKAE